MSSHPTSTAKTPDVSRRRALKRLAVGAGAGTLAAAAVASPAGAATGGTLTLGSTANTADQATLVKTSGIIPYGFGITDATSADNFTAAALFAHASGHGSFYNGLEVAATGDAQGLFAHAEEGPGGTIRGNRLGLNVSSLAGTGLEVSCANQGLGARITASNGGQAADLRADGPTAVQIANNGTTGRGLSIVSPGSQVLLDPSQAPTPAAAPQASVVGELRAADDGTLWFCVAAGNPGTWRKVAGPTAAGSLHVLPAPARVYDSRPFTKPNVGTKSPFVPDQIRTIDLKVNGSGVPAGATAAMVNLLLVNAATGSGNVTVWSAGVPRPSGNSMVWGGNAGRFSTTTLTALDANACCQVVTSAKTDVVLDVIGFHL